jgi:hypothetical protein
MPELLEDGQVVGGIAAPVGLVDGSEERGAFSMSCSDTVRILNSVA